MDDQLTYLVIIVGSWLSFGVQSQLQFVFVLWALYAWYRAKPKTIWE